MNRDRRALLMGGSILGVCAIAGLLPTGCPARRSTRSPVAAMENHPKRPDGKAKPMLQEDIAPVLAQLDAWFAANLPADKYVFNPPASDAEIDELQALLGVRLPASLRQLYRWHNGEDDDRWGHFYGLPLLPLKCVAYEWKAKKDVLRDFVGNRYAVAGGAWPSNAVDSAYINPAWVPLTSDGSGGHIGLDFDPWPDGRIGQVILFGRDEDVKVVLAESLGTFLQWILGLLESGNFRLDVAEGETVLRQFRLKQPAVDDFHEGARVLLGAPAQFL